MTIEPGIGAGVRSPQAEARLDRAAASHLPVPMPDLADHAAVAVWRRAVHEAWGEDLGDPPHEHAEIAGVPCLTVGPRDAPVVVYAHGGGYVLGSAAVAVPITQALGRRLRVVSVDYRLAPEHPFPAALDDVTAVARVLAADGPIALAGDSAGGGLALAAARRLRDERLPVRSLVLLSPHLRHDPTHALSAAYLAGADADDPEASPLLAELAYMPPTFVQVDAGEALFDQAAAYARRARSAGVPVTLDVWLGLWHTWQYHPELPEAQRALSDAAAFVRRALESAPWSRR